MTENNVIRFPQFRRNIPKISEAVLKEHNLSQAEEVISDLMGHIVQILHYEGYDIANDDSIMHHAYLLEDSIRSAIYASIQQEHPLHEIAEDCYRDNEEGTPVPEE